MTKESIKNTSLEKMNKLIEWMSDTEDFINHRNRCCAIHSYGVAQRYLGEYEGLCWANSNFFDEDYKAAYQLLDDLMKKIFDM